MEAPKKIYIDDFGSELSYDWHTEHSYKKDVEYIRKDAFIERTCEYLEPILTEYAGFYVGGDILQHFKKYMEGE